MTNPDFEKVYIGIPVQVNETDGTKQNTTVCVVTISLIKVYSMCNVRKYVKNRFRLHDCWNSYSNIHY
jgi:hypothetical protein